MITFTFHIRAKPGCEARALQALSTIERESRSHEGCIAFTWLQRDDVPHDFMLFEQWENEAALEAHKARLPGTWDEFVECLDGEPSSRSYRSVSAMATPPSEDETRSFVQQWFDKLSAHVDVDDLLPMISSGPDLEIAFPERTLTSHADFREWYEGIGNEYSAQAHDVETLNVGPSEDGRTGLDLTVLWNADRHDGSSVSARAHQSWELRRSFATGAPEILKYRVLSLTDAPSAV